MRDLWGFMRFRRPDAYGDWYRSRAEPMDADLFVRNCRVVKPDGVVDCGLAIRGGSIAAVLRRGETVHRPSHHRRGRRYVIPGLLDTHLHLGNAAQAFASDCATESRHAVAGGVTTLMPFVITRGSYLEALGEMQRAVSSLSVVDMLFHAIIVREAQIDEIPRMASEFGVRSFKAFMAYKGREISPSGIQGMGDDQIFSMFQRVKDVPGGVAIVHCENMEIIELHQKPLMAAGRQDTAAWSDGRPAWGELEAIRRMCQFAEAAAVQLLIPHMGVGLGSEFLRQKAWGRRPRRHRELPALPGLRQGHRPRRAGQGEPAAPRARPHRRALAAPHRRHRRRDGLRPLPLHEGGEGRRALGARAPASPREAP